MTILIVDARTRNLDVFTASVTCLTSDPKALILRKAVVVGMLKDLAGREFQLPVLVVGCYQARGSAGYVTPVGNENHKTVLWIGGAGFGYVKTDDEGKRVHRGSALRPFSRPVHGTLLPAGTRIERVETHSNSNQSTADAAFEGLGLKVLCDPRLFILAEGQSDSTSAYSFRVPEGVKYPEFPEEHQTETFSPRSIVKAAMRLLAKHKNGCIPLTYAIARAHLRAGQGIDNSTDFPVAIFELLGKEKVEGIIDAEVLIYETEGWKFGFARIQAKHFTRAVDPNGTITDGHALCDKAVKAKFDELATYDSSKDGTNVAPAS